jgi:hypothetical protein
MPSPSHPTCIVPSRATAVGVQSRFFDPESLKVIITG